MKKFSVALLLCLTLVFSTTVSFAAQNNIQKNNSAVNANVINLNGNEASKINVEPNATRNYPFDIVIPWVGSIYTSSSYTMTAGKYCIVQRTDSVNKSAVFRVVDANTLTPLGNWVTVQSGESRLIYTNTSGTTKYVKIEMSSNNITSVHVQGYFKFGEF